MLGVLESLLPGLACFFLPLTVRVFLPSFSILPVAVPGVGAMLGVLELWLGSSAFFLAAFAFAFAPGVSALGAPAGFGCIDGLELEGLVLVCALAASAPIAKAAAANIRVLESMRPSRVARARGFSALRRDNAGGNSKVPLDVVVCSFFVLDLGLDYMHIRAALLVEGGVNR